VSLVSSQSATRNVAVRAIGWISAVATGFHASPSRTSRRTVLPSASPRGGIWAVIFNTPRLSVCWAHSTGPNARSGWAATFAPETRQSRNHTVPLAFFGALTTSAMLPTSPFGSAGRWISASCRPVSGSWAESVSL
jgi:hypothetical protein